MMVEGRYCAACVLRGAMRVMRMPCVVTCYTFVCEVWFVKCR